MYVYIKTRTWGLAYGSDRIFTAYLCTDVEVFKTRSTESDFNKLKIVSLLNLDKFLSCVLTE